MGDEELYINTIRFLSVDQVEAAGNGHPGLPLGAAPMAFVLWDRFLQHNPADPKWPNRDRFVLSAGHGSALLYSLLHLYGYGLTLDDLRNFRQYGSRTPGHPEHGVTPGVEATTGPLGQGFAMGVGMALAERFLGDRYNRPGFPIVDHRTFAIVSDGDLMEGIGSEAASIAGSMRLGKLTYLYDDNHITIEGPTTLAFREDVRKRFEAYGWRVLQLPDGNDTAAIDTALRSATADATAPTLIMIRTHIGYGSPRQDTAAAHGEALGPEATKQTKENLHWPLDPTFLVPDASRTHFSAAIERGAKWQSDWDRLFAGYRSAYPELARELEAAWSGTLPVGWDAALPTFDPTKGAVATRDASAAVLNALAAKLPTLLGGAADLAPSTKTFLNGFGDLGAAEAGGRNLHFGVRELGMSGIVNGLALHGGVIPYGSTFFIFSDYARPALRLAALMGVHALFIFTHDSIGLGEDGPTHQPIEQLTALRAVPGFTVIRPADANETTEAYRIALARPGPVALVLTRQKLPVLDPLKYQIHAGVGKGAYVLSDPSGGTPQVALLATGSEVSLALAAQSALSSRGIRARVVSMPSWELFDEQPKEYRDSVLLPGVPRVAIEAGSPLAWPRYVGPDGPIIGLDRFGASGPAPVVFRELGFNVDHVVDVAARAARGASAG